MPFPERPAYFAPRQVRGFFAARSALFLVDPERLLDVAGNHILGKDLIPRIHNKPLGERVYAAGALVPALGLETGYYTVDVRSTATEASPLALTHIVFSSGFVLGTETGKLILANGDRLTPWSPGTAPPSRTPRPLGEYERGIEVSPGWYSVTVVAGIAEAEVDAGEAAPRGGDEEFDFNQDTWDDETQTHRARGARRRPRQVEQEELWVCSFLLDPRPGQPEFTADANKSLNLFGNEATSRPGA
jgi:hypothetical protein